MKVPSASGRNLTAAAKHSVSAMAHWISGLKADPSKQKVCPACSKRYMPSRTDGPKAYADRKVCYEKACIIEGRRLAAKRRKPRDETARQLPSDVMARQWGGITIGEES